MITIHESGKAPIFLKKAPEDLTQYTPAALRHTLTSLESDRLADKAVVRGAFVNLPQSPMRKKGAFQFNDESIGQRLNVEMLVMKWPLEVICICMHIHLVVEVLV